MRSKIATANVVEVTGPQAPGPREIAPEIAPGWPRPVLVSLIAGLIEIFQSIEPHTRIDGISSAIEHRVGRAERGALLMISAAAAHPSDVKALAEAAHPQPRFYGPTGAPPCPEPISRYRPLRLTDEERRRAEAIPPFELPPDEFAAMMCTSSAPLLARKRALLRLWDSFDEATKRACAAFLMKQLNSRRGP